MRIKLGGGQIRFADLKNDKILKEKIKNVLDYHNILLAGLNSKLLTEKNIHDEINLYKNRILKFVDRISPILKHAKNKGKKSFLKEPKGFY